MNDLDKARYVSLTTFKRDGTPVATPVWITGRGGTYSFTTGDKAWKTRRLLHNPSVKVQVCDMRGRVKPPATLYSGRGEVLSSADAISATETALAAKYGWQFKATKVTDGLKSKLGRSNPRGVVAIQLSIDATVS